MAEQRESAYPWNLDLLFCFCFRRDSDDAERVEERLALRAVLLDEDVVGRPSAERFARIAVEVREREAYLFLRERIEARSLLEDAPRESVARLGPRRATD